VYSSVACFVIAVCDIGNGICVLHASSDCLHLS